MSTTTSPEGMAWQNAYLKLRNTRERAGVAVVSADTARLWRIFKRFHEDRVQVLHSQVRADEYRGKASDASALAKSSVLPQVRARHEFAASRWSELAAREERQVLSLGRRFGRAAQALSPAQPDREEAPCSA